MIKYECCYHCKPPKRHPGCQGPKCEEWVEITKRIEAEREEIRKNKEKESLVVGFKIDGVLRARKWRK